MQTQPRHFWKHDVTTMAIEAGVSAEWLRERFNERMTIWYNAGETVQGAAEMVVFTWKQEPIELRKEADDMGAIRQAAREGR